MNETSSRLKDRLLIVVCKTERRHDGGHTVYCSFQVIYCILKSISDSFPVRYTVPIGHMNGFKRYWYKILGKIGNGEG